MLIVAGNDTTTNLIANGAVLLAEHPEQRRCSAQIRPLIADAIEEMLRYESPAQALPRRVTRDVALHGVTIPSGAMVRLVWAAANRDEREFEDADRFDVHAPVAAPPRLRPRRPLLPRREPRAARGARRVRGAAGARARLRAGGAGPVAALDVGARARERADRVPRRALMEHRLAAIFSADAAGYTRLLAEEQAATIRALAEAREPFAQASRSIAGA